jgi:hypothetical protein
MRRTLEKNPFILFYFPLGLGRVVSIIDFWYSIFWQYGIVCLVLELILKIWASQTQFHPHCTMYCMEY